MAYLQRITVKGIINDVGGVCYDAMKRLPVVGAKIELEAKKLEDDMARDMHKNVKRPDELSKIPELSTPAAQILQEMKGMSDAEVEKWRNGRVSGAVYHGGAEHQQLLADAYALYGVSNPLHPDLWPSVSKYEAEVAAMASSLLNGGDSSVCGLVTSGGTESIFMSIKAHRVWGEKERGITEPELVMPATAHAAFDKACELMRIKLVKVAVDPRTQRVLVKRVRKAINSNTILIVGSAPQFPHGSIDPISELSALAVKYGVGLHVDCCLGGFFLPFARRLGAPIPPFNFELPGVTAISCDTHKYGYAAKGSSVVLYRNKDLRHCAYFKYADWPGGLYATPTLPGSRAGALSAACWASIRHMGMEGYLRATKDILDTVEKIKSGVEAINELFIVGEPDAMIVAFGSHVVNIHQVNDLLSKRGWSLNSLQNPPAVHITCTLRHVGRADEFITDLAATVAQVKALPPAARGKEGGDVQIYGLTGSVPAGCVEDLMNAYIDVTLML